MRGGVSVAFFAPKKRKRSSPRAWGCFSCQWILLCRQNVFPTCVGVFPRCGAPSICGSRLPHVRGGVSEQKDFQEDERVSSPRAWGCFLTSQLSSLFRRVFPTCVGVFLQLDVRGRMAAGLPHVRGGVSHWRWPLSSPYWSSPRAWGCFHYRQRHPRLHLGLPHVRGGVSFTIGSNFQEFSSSPRAWGCFLDALRDEPESEVFPTCVGVFLRQAHLMSSSWGLPHVRGGVSHSPGEIPCFMESSPRAWGCFYVRVWGGIAACVFPTCVGVFLGRRGKAGELESLPHVRGGVSRPKSPCRKGSTSSPRAWGCFPTSLPSGAFRVVFPTCVGVFPNRSLASIVKQCLPHVRGGVST